MTASGGTADRIADQPAEMGEPRLRELRRRLAPALVEAARLGRTALADEVLEERPSFYLDRDRFELERERLFRDLPLVACLSAELPGPGTFRTFDDAGVPMILTRGRDGQVRAFLNVCPHRAGRIVREPCGRASRFTCRFHGWTFGADGAAIGIPEESYFARGIGAQTRLVACPVEERFGLVFVRTEPGQILDLDRHLGDLQADLAAIGLETAQIVHADDLPVAANWKYGLDTFFETYHLNSLHRETFRGLFSPICVFDRFGPHHRFTFAPLGIADWVGAAPEAWAIDSVPLQYFLFPNTIISVGSTSQSGSSVNIHRIFPQAVDRFVSKLAYCALGGVRSAEHREEIERAYATSRAALVTEDYSVAAESLAGLRALPPETTLPIGRQEIGVQNFHQNVKRRIGAE